MKHECKAFLMNCWVCWGDFVDTGEAVVSASFSYAAGFLLAPEALLQHETGRMTGIKLYSSLQFPWLFAHKSNVLTETTGACCWKVPTIILILIILFWNFASYLLLKLLKQNSWDCAVALHMSEKFLLTFCILLLISIYHL